MAKVTRLFRLENVFGKGLYQTDARIGHRIYTETTYDTDLYRNGKPCTIAYRNRRGETHIVPGNDLMMTATVIDFMELYGGCLQQLRLDLDGEGSTTPKTRWGTLVDKEQYYGVESIDPEMSYDSYTRAMMRQLHQPPMQMSLEVTVEPRAIKHTIKASGGLTLADLIEENVHLSGDRDFADTSAARPMPHDDGISFKGSMQDEWFYAFKSVKQMSDWLDGTSPKQCLDNGAVIKIVEVRKAMHGGCQSVFRKKDVVREIVVATRDLSQMARAYFQ